MSLRVLLHRQFVASWKILAIAEQNSIRRMLKLLSEENVTPGMRPHMVGPFLSLSPNMDLRVIALRNANDLVLFYVDHHDAAYRWASSRTVLAGEIPTPELVTLSSVELISSREISTRHLPIPVEEILALKEQDAFLEAISEMSPEWQEWLFSAYTADNGRSEAPTASSLVFSPVSDAELSRALTLDLEEWTLFLHPKQQEAVDDKASSIAVFGGPGTGKTVVLLRRIIEHSPKRGEEDCSILLTYSEGLSELYEKQLRSVSGRHYYVLPLYHLGGNVPVKARGKAVMRKLALEVEDGQVLIRYSNMERRNVRELLIDETQDIPRDVIPTLRTLCNAGKTRLVLAADLDQSIHRGRLGDVEELLEDCSSHHELGYCYRSTRQIIDCAREWIRAAGVSTVSPTAFGLSGPRVRFVVSAGLSEQVEETARTIQDLEQRYDPRSLAVIYCQYFNPSFKGGSKEEAALKGDLRTAKAYRFASLTKGKEYFAGVVFVSGSFLEKRSTEAADRLRINTLYVAITRFRDEVTIVYPRGCAIERTLGVMEAAID